MHLWGVVAVEVHHVWLPCEHDTHKSDCAMFGTRMFAAIPSRTRVSDNDDGIVGLDEGTISGLAEGETRQPLILDLEGALCNLRRGAQELE